MESTLGTQLPLFSAVPFIGMLLSIALLPMLTPKFWHHHFGKISAGWAALLAIPLIVAYGEDATHEFIKVVLADYIPFIILLCTLFTVGGGILIRTKIKGTTIVNVCFLSIGALLASLMGTTGAAMLLIRPFLKVNKHRKYRGFMLVFFIFIVANIGGALTPLGDPPLFLGFLYGVPFLWTLRLIPLWLTSILTLLLVYIAFDIFYLRKEHKEKPVDSVPSADKSFEILGKQNLILLAAVIAVILFSGNVKMAEVTLLGSQLGLQDIIRDILLVAITFVSVRITPRLLRVENEFTWAPIQEVAYLFFGIFITMAPVLSILKAGESGALGFITTAVKEPAHYFWASGSLSSFLDNAPTYLTFFSTALGQFYPNLPEHSAVVQLMTHHPAYLMAISAGSVFMGANTYIGNAPNFMVRSIAEESGIPMPSFFGYMAYSMCILIPLFALLTLIFF